MYGLTLSQLGCRRGSNVWNKSKSIRTGRGMGRRSGRADEIIEWILPKPLGLCSSGFEVRTRDLY